MRLTRIELGGFKSFADSVDLHFGEGVIAIVGPNGCGKSNISDAVRWVLGEQRARLLRSQRMDEVIFQGSVKRRPVNLAEVSLVFDNSSGMLPIAFHEVVLTRRLVRSGQSEYLLNQSPVRLRDVMDVLRGTGLGSDAGVVLEGQMIDRLLSDRTEERRSLFEEAAGIALFRDRKESTERRLERTTTDLQRLDDIIGEVQTQVRSLARQRGKTERHREYTEQRFHVVMTLARRELAAFDRDHIQLRQRQETLRVHLPAAREALTHQERLREQRAQERAAAEARRTELERQLAEARVEIERLEGDVNVAGERLQHAGERRTKATEERAQAEARVAQLEREVEAASAERQAAESARTSVQTELDLRTASEDQTKERLATQRLAVRTLEESLQQLAESLRSLAGERSVLERDLAELRRQETEAGDRAGIALREVEVARSDMATARATLADRERQERETSARLERARHALAAAREHEAAVRIERREVENSIAQIAARREVLAELERKREGLAPAVRALLQNTDRFGSGAVLGPLSDFITIGRDRADLAERLLGDWLQAVLVRDETTIEAVRQWHSEARPGPLMLLPVEPGPAAGAYADSDLGLRVSAPAERWVEALLRDSRAAGADGTVIHRANGAVFLPGPSAGGSLSRRAELDQLQRDLDDASQRLEDLTVKADAAQQAHSAAERELEAATEHMARARAEVREAQGAADDTGRRLQRLEREATEAEEAQQRLSQRASERQNRMQTAAAEAAAAEAERIRLTEDLGAQHAVLRDLESAQEAARERRVHWQVEEAQVSARERAATERESRANAALGEVTDTLAGLARELAEIDQATQTLTDRQSTSRDRLTERRMAVQEMESAAMSAVTALQAADEALAEVEASIEQAREQLDAANEESHQVELSLTEAHGQRRGLVERIEGEWHKSLDALLAEAPEIEGATEDLRAEAERLVEELERIGPVNPLAVEEHAEEQKRLQFLQEQRDDLIAARDSLRHALREIEGTARDLFLETFAAVRENFHSVFHTLFEGGECDVRLADESDPLGSDILIQAAPRGKRTQRIHLLSSGERALVAISLLFAIYLTKPSPFCLLDEVDAPLDDANVMRFVRLLEEFKSQTQFIVITHNPRTMQVADAVYGVTMQEPGVSTIVGVRLGEEEPAVA